MALTSAQHQLTVSWSTTSDDGKDSVPCEFVAELEQDGLYPEDVTVPAATLAAARRAELAPPPCRTRPYLRSYWLVYPECHQLECLPHMSASLLL